MKAISYYVYLCIQNNLDFAVQILKSYMKKTELPENIEFKRELKKKFNKKTTLFKHFGNTFFLLKVNEYSHFIYHFLAGFIFQR